MAAISSRASSDYNTVTAASQQLVAMTAGRTYRFVSSVDAYVAVGTNPTASAADNSHYVAAGRELLVRAVATNDLVAVIRVGGADGVCTLSLLEDIP